MLPTKYERGKREREGQDLLYYLQATMLLVRSHHPPIPHAIALWVLGKAALESNKTLIMRPVSECLLIPLRFSNPLRCVSDLQVATYTQPWGALSLMSIYTRSDESYLLGSKIPVVALGNELPRVLIVAIPRGLRTCKRSREAVSASLEIEDCVDSVSAAADSDHDRILVRTHDVCDAIEHGFPFVRG